jgi:hypothetical protein
MPRRAGRIAELLTAAAPSVAALSDDDLRQMRATASGRSRRSPRQPQRLAWRGARRAGGSSVVRARRDGDDEGAAWVEEGEGAWVAWVLDDLISVLVHIRVVR